jgi:hypothetical protein
MRAVEGRVEARAALPSTEPDAPTRQLVSRALRNPRLWLFIAAGVLLVAAYAVELLTPINRDEGAFLVIAQAVLRGQMPYRDLFDQKTPAIYYVLAGVLWLSRGASPLTQVLLGRVVVLIANLLTAAGLLVLGKRWWSAGIGAGAALLWLLVLPVYAGTQLFTEPFAATFTVWACVAAPAQRRIRAAALAGLLLAVGVLFKQTTLLAVPGVALVLYGEARQARAHFKGIRWMRDIALAFSAGLTLPLIAVAGAFALGGVLGPLIQQAVLANLFHYPADPADFNRELLTEAVFASLAVWATTLVVICVGAWRWLAHRHEQRSIMFPYGPAAVALIAVLNTLPFATHAYPHYWLQILPWAALLTAAGLARFTPRVRTGDGGSAGQAGRVGLAVVGGPLLLASALALTALLPALLAVNTPQRAEVMTSQADVGPWINQHAPAPARLLVAPADPQYYFVAGRDPITPYVYLLPINMTPTLDAQVQQDLRAHRFDAVVWHADPAAPDHQRPYAGIYAVLLSSYHVVATYPAQGLILYEPNTAG